MGVGNSGEKKDTAKAKSDTGTLGTKWVDQFDWYEGICW